MILYSKNKCLDQCSKYPLDLKKLLKQQSLKQHLVIPNSIKQQGVVLFFALIALVVMSLAAVALIRSVDTNSIIAGNLSFKQSTMFSADRGVETALAWVIANEALLEADSVANGYYATSDVVPHLNARALVDASGVTDTLDDGQGNAVRYVVQRMCQNPGPASRGAPAFCLFGPTIEVPDDHGAVPPPPSKFAPSLIYRVTARVVGPKNTVSYIQSFVY